MKPARFLYVTTLAILFPVSANAGLLDAIKTAKQIGDAKDMYDSVQSIKTVKGMENAEPIFTGVKKLYLSVDLRPSEGDATKMNELVGEVVCDNVERIVDNLDKFDMEGAEPKCKTGESAKPGKKKIVLMTIRQDASTPGINATVSYVDNAENKTLKTFSISGVQTYYQLVEKIVDDLHGDLVLSSRTNNPVTLRKWPSRFKKYNAKSKHRKIDMKRKQRKQLEANKAE